MTNLVLLAYGRTTEYYRAIFATLSFWAWYGGKREEVRVVVYTDDDVAFQPHLAGLPVEYRRLAPADLAAMQGPHGYIHRIKGVIIDRTFQAYPADAVLFFDSDTFFTAAPEALLAGLGAGQVFMHQREYTLAEAVDIYAGFGQAEYPSKLIAYLAGQRFWVNGAEVQFTQTQPTWNSGVLGLPAATAALVPEVCALMDDFYAHSGWFTSEQVAFSLALQVQHSLLPSDQYVYHYWGKRQKVLMDGLLAAVLTPAFGRLALAERLAHVRQLVPQWRRQVELDKVQEGALYAFANGQRYAGVKYTAKALLAAPLNLKFAKEAYHAFQRGQAAVEA